MYLSSLSSPQKYLSTFFPSVDFNAFVWTQSDTGKPGDTQGFGMKHEMAEAKEYFKLQYRYYYFN